MFRGRLRAVLSQIKSGEFAREWQGEYARGSKQYKSLLESDLNHPIEAVGHRLRERMPWLKEAS